jgi:hypothetical protein
MSYSLSTTLVSRRFAFAHHLAPGRSPRLLQSTAPRCQVVGFAETALVGRVCRSRQQTLPDICGAREVRSDRRSGECGTTCTRTIADAYTDQVWELPEKALTNQWAIFPGLGKISALKR